MAGDGEFQVALNARGGAAEVGVIPKGKFDVRIDLTSGVDIDIQIYDLDDTNTFSEGQAVVAWCQASTCNVGELGLNAGYKEIVYKGMTVKYSGFQGDGTNFGHEYIEIEGESSVRMMMKVWAMDPGSATVKYSWGEDQSDCCTGRDVCSGSFVQSILYREIVNVGDIPAGKLDVYIQLESESDVDIQIYDKDTYSPYPEGHPAIVAWCPEPCNIGVLNGRGEETADYPPNFLSDLLGITPTVTNQNSYTYSGFGGVESKPGHEYIRIPGELKRNLQMKALGYRSGFATVTYSYRNPLIARSSGSNRSSVKEKSTLVQPKSKAALSSGSKRVGGRIGRSPNNPTEEYMKFMFMG